MGDWNAGVSRDRSGRRDPGDDFEGDPGLDQGHRFLPSPPEDEGVAPLQSNYLFALLGLGHQKLVDLILAQGVSPRALSHKDCLAFGCGVV